MRFKSHYSQSSRENVTPSSVHPHKPLYKEVPPPPPHRDAPKLLSLLDFLSILSVKCLRIQFWFVIRNALSRHERQCGIF